MEMKSEKWDEEDLKMYNREPSLWKEGDSLQKIEVAQNGLKHILVLEFLKSDEFLNIGNFL